MIFFETNECKLSQSPSSDFPCEEVKKTCSPGGDSGCEWWSCHIGGRGNPANMELRPLLEHVAELLLFRKVQTREVGVLSLPRQVVHQVLP